MKKEDIFNKIVSENNERIHRICRYKPFSKKEVWIFIGILIMDVSLCFSSLPYNISIIEFQFFYWGLIILAAIVELVLWYIKYKPIRDNLLRLIDEM